MQASYIQVRSCNYKKEEKSVAEYKGKHVEGMQNLEILCICVIING